MEASFAKHTASLRIIEGIVSANRGRAVPVNQKKSVVVERASARTGLALNLSGAPTTNGLQHRVDNEDKHARDSEIRQ